MSVNLTILVGRLGKDPEISQTKSGLAKATFSLATSRPRKAGSEGSTETDWHFITCFGKTAEMAGKWLKKGKQVYLECSLRQNSFDKDGKKVYRTDINCNKIQFLSGKDEVQQDQPQEAAPVNREVYQDIPF